MTVSELLKKLAAAFPAFNAGAAEAWAPVFRAVCQAHEGEKLTQAYAATLASFTVKRTKSLFPLPADIAEHLPDPHGEIAKLGPKLDLAAHAMRKREIMSEWRAAQGQRGANGSREVLLALESIAEPIASYKAWRPSGEPLRLTGKQLKLAQHRAISLERRHIHGALRDSTTSDEWWPQISEIAARWNIPTDYAEWLAPAKAPQ